MTMLLTINITGPARRLALEDDVDANNNRSPARGLTIDDDVDAKYDQRHIDAVEPTGVDNRHNDNNSIYYLYQLRVYGL